MGRTYSHQVRCGHCGTVFEGKTPNVKYCPECRPFMRQLQVRQHQEAKSKRRELERVQRVMKKYKGLDEAVRKCKEQGISYADAQKQKTLEMYARVKI